MKNNKNIKYKITSLNINKNNYTFIPDSELINLAESFSNSYHKLSIGQYCSDNSKYQIDYLERIIDKNTGQKLSTGARISNNTGIIEIDKFIFNSKEYTPDFLFFIIIWCIIIKDTNNIMLSDKIAIEYYNTTERSKKNLMMGYIELFSKSPSPLNKNRYEYVCKKLKPNYSRKINIKILNNDNKSFERLITIISYIQSLDSTLLNITRILRYIYKIDEKSIIQINSSVTSLTYHKCQNKSLPMLLWFSITRHPEIFEDYFTVKIVNKSFLNINEDKSTIHSIKEPELKLLSKYEIRLINDIVNYYKDLNTESITDEVKGKLIIV